MKLSLSERESKCLFIIRWFQMVVIYQRLPLRLATLYAALREACKQPSNQPITIKWIDEEGTLFIKKVVGYDILYFTSEVLVLDVNIAR